MMNLRKVSSRAKSTTSRQQTQLQYRAAHAKSTAPHLPAHSLPHVQYCPFAVRHFPTRPLRHVR
eukprot:2519328-Rhodomonas_salina.1